MNDNSVNILMVKNIAKVIKNLSRPVSAVVGAKDIQCPIRNSDNKCTTRDNSVEWSMDRVPVKVMNNPGRPPLTVSEEDEGAV